ncbi:MAG: CinA family protein, partial [Sphingobacterium thalpophilum]
KSNFRFYGGQESELVGCRKLYRRLYFPSNYATPGQQYGFLGGAVTYSNSLKISILGVSEKTLNNFGAVSEETVKEMSEGAKSAFHSDYSIAVSGVAGPDGGTIEKPVGTVWIAVTGKTKTITKTYNFGNKRTQNIERSGTTALTLLYKLMKEEQFS